MKGTLLEHSGCSTTIVFTAESSAEAFLGKLCFPKANAYLENLLVPKIAVHSTWLMWPLRLSTVFRNSLPSISDKENWQEPRI